MKNKEKPEEINLEAFDAGTILDVDVEKEVKTSFMDYSMSVIVSRALPDVRDGLKPVHRRILYTMSEKGLTHDKPYHKSADTVGAVLGSYHPHGDASVYDAMVRLAQDFSMRYPLIDPQGNFGSVDGDPPAAYRYTEARMSRLADYMLMDIDKDTVDFVPNYDDRLTEPSVLPSRIPNLLMNGSSGIAVGMATNIPPHNLGELIDGINYIIDNPDCDSLQLMDCIKGPDFPTGGIIMGRAGIRAAYSTGRGKITLRGRAGIEDDSDGNTRIVITEIPYMVNKARLIEKIADLVKDKRVEGIRDLRDESDREGMRIVVELKRDANAQIVLNKLYKYTQLQDTIGVIMLALKDGSPKVMNLKEMLSSYLDFQKEVVTRRTRFDLKKAQERAHILEGLRRAVDIVDEIIATIRACKGGQADAKQAIMDKFGFDDPQAQAIVQYRLGQLAGLEILKIENELSDLLKRIAEFEDILMNERHLYRIIQEELNDAREKFNDERRTEIAAITGEVDIEDLIPDEICVITRSFLGYVKRQAVDVYRSQNRGGRGKRGTSTREDDFIEDLFICSTHDHLVFFTNRGKIYRIKAYEIPEGSFQAKGLNIVNILPLEPGEKVASMLAIRDFSEEDAYLVLVTRKGTIKRTALSLYSNIRKSGIIAINLDEDDELAWSVLTSGDDELIIATENGNIIRFSETDARPIGRTARGVRAISLRPGDRVVSMSSIWKDAKLLTVTTDGKGRVSSLSGYRKQNRGGFGVRNYDCSRGTKVAGVTMVIPGDDVIIITEAGIVIRTSVNEISEQSRYGGGVRVVRLDTGDKVTAVIGAPKEELEETTDEAEFSDNADLVISEDSGEV